MDESIKEDRYDHHKKNICDEKGVYMPKHTHAVIISMLEQVLINQSVILSRFDSISSVAEKIHPPNSKEKIKQ